MKTIGPFELLDEIGRGAMGVVYRAKDPAIGRLVAIKLIRMDAVSDSPEDEFLRGRLLREAQSAGVLSHPGIVTIYSIAKENDIAYIAMEYVNGPTLEKLISPGSPALSRQAVRDILTQTATALDYAHRRGVVHRDVKPANIMIDEDGQAKICDFGVAKVFGGQKTVTRAGYVLGTPYYMSAEQIQGKPLDGRADQYSLAVIAYRMLAGIRPFDAETMETLLFQIIFGESQAAHELNRSLPPQAADALRKGLAKKPEDRFANCREFVDAVLRACDLNPDWNPPAPGAPPPPPRDPDEPEPERQAPAAVPVMPGGHPPAAPLQKVGAETGERCRNCGGQAEPGVGLCTFCASFGVAALPPQPVIAGPPPPPPLRPPTRPLPPPPPPPGLPVKSAPQVTAGNVPVPNATPSAPPLEARETGPAPAGTAGRKALLVGLIVIAAVAVATLAYWKNRPAVSPPIVSEVQEPPVAPPAAVQPEQKPVSKAPEPEPVKPEPPKPKPVKPEPVKPEPVKLEPPKLEPPKPKPTVPVVVTPQPAPSPPPAPPKPKERALLSPEKYRGPLEGALTCPGEFAASSTVVIDDLRSCSQKLPNVAAELRITVNPPDATVVESPSAANKWQRLVLRMPNRAVPSVRIRWELK